MRCCRLIATCRPAGTPFLALALLLGAAMVARAGDAGVEALIAEVRPARELMNPQTPVLVRFALHNPTGNPVVVPVAELLADDAVALPRSIVLGEPGQPALRVTLNQELPIELPASAPVSTQPTPGVLRIGPYGSVGLTLDLRDLHNIARYPGSYRLEWRPLGGRIAPATAAFRVERRKQAIIVTDLGKMTFRLLYDEAPRNVEGFLELASSNFYVGKSFHRVIPGYLIQAGDAKGDGSGLRPDGKLLPAEFHGHSFDAGTLAMARKPSDPHSASAQFFITLDRAPELDGQYTVIGQARDEETMRTLAAIAAVPTDARDRPLRPVVIRSVNLVDAPEEQRPVLHLSPTTMRSAPSRGE